ncbi:hypothetical protein ACLOJK_030510 [Asimina triloba]
MDLEASIFYLLLPLILLPLLWKMQISKGRLRLPPGPTKLPIIGNLHQLRGLPHRALAKVAKQHGPLSYVRFGSVPAVVVSSADMAKEVIKTHDLAFAGRPCGLASRKLSYGCLDMVFSPYGDYWRHLRKVCAQELLSVTRVQSFRSIRAREVSHMIHSIRQAAPLGPINISHVLLSLTNSIICTAAFGSKYGGSRDENSKFQGILGESNEVIIGFSVADFFPWLEWISRVTGLEEKLDKVFRKLDCFFEMVIEEHLDPARPKPEQEDFIDVMLRVQKDASRGISLTRQHIKAVIMDMFLAGTDTTFATLLWSMTELIRHPRIMMKAQEEVRKIVGEKKSVEEEDVQQLDYLETNNKGGSQATPSVPRECTESCSVNGYDVPIKTRLFVNVWAIMRDPEFWEDPEEFRPERFAGTDFDFTGQNFQYVPFGSGRRRCPGNSFGTANAELALASLLHCFDWELPEGMRKEDVNMDEALGLALHKKVALHLVATSRF